MSSHEITSFLHLIYDISFGNNILGPMRGWKKIDLRKTMDKDLRKLKSAGVFPMAFESGPCNMHGEKKFSRIHPADEA